MDELAPYGDQNAVAEGSTVSIGDDGRGRWVPAVIVGAIAVIIAVSIASSNGSDSATTATTLDSAEAPTAPLEPDADPSSNDGPTSTTNTTTTAPPVATTPSTTIPRGTIEGIPIALPNEGIDAWLFAVNEASVTRVDLLTGERQVVDTDADLAPPRNSPLGRVTMVDDQLVVIGANQILLIHTESLDVGALPVPDMTFLARGNSAVWTSTANRGDGTRSVHRVPIDGATMVTADMNLSLPFPFLVTASVPDGLLVSELLGATWLIGDDGLVERRDEISSVLASGDAAYLATSCAPNAMLCTLAIHAADGSERSAVVTDDFNFGTPLSPDGRWLASGAGFVDIETGTRLPRPRGLFGSNLGSWSLDSRWYVEPTPAVVRLHDLSGEFESMSISGFDAETELHLVLR